MHSGIYLHRKAMQDYKKEIFDFDTVVTQWQAWLSAHGIQEAVHYCDLCKRFVVIEHCEHTCQTARNTGETHQGLGVSKVSTTAW